MRESRATSTAKSQETVIRTKSGKPARILVAEDISTNMLLAKALISRLIPDVEIFEALNGREAVVAAGKQSFDLILMDINMPELDGREAARQIRKNENHCENPVPIVAFTASALKEEMEKCEAAGMNDFLTKPITSDAMSRVLNKFLAECNFAAPCQEQKPTIEAAQRFNKAAFIEQIGDDNNLKKELFTGFRNDAINRLRIIEVCIESQEKEKIRRAAHAIKGSALNMAFNELARLAGALEACALKEESPMKEAFKQLTSEWHCVSKLIDAELAGLG